MEKWAPHTVIETREAAKVFLSIPNNENLTEFIARLNSLFYDCSGNKEYALDVPIWDIEKMKIVLTK